MKNKYNATFNRGPDTNLNACVGTNGGQDHWKYGHGYNEAVGTIISALKNGKMTVDSAVYPLVFCARHRIELFLKDQLLKIPDIRPINNDIDKVVNSSHDLHNLWEIFEKLGSKTDRRIIPFLESARRYISDFAETDPTGETFRYPYDKEKMLHLAETPIINIDVFALRYEELSLLMERFDHLTNYLIEEYRQGTFTDTLSREDLYQISLELPPRSDWSNPEFNDIRKRLRLKYNLSGNSLSKALDIIQNHREFCVNIGMQIPLISLNQESFEKYLRIYREYHSNTETITNLAACVSGSKEHLVRRLSDELPKEAVVTLFALLELGRHFVFGESYDAIYSLWAKNYENEGMHFYVSATTIRNTKALEYIQKALKMTGQTTLLKCFTR